MPSPAKRVYFEDYMFVVDENVYAPAEDSFLFAENLKVNAGESVLDMGTGCGILGVLAAKKAREVIAIDVNPYAVRCAKHNAEVNNVRDKLAVIHGDLFTWLSEKATFDVILFNAPYLPENESATSSWINRAWAGGVTGRQVIDRFLSECPKHLQRSGRILLMQSTLADMNETVRRFADHRMRTRVLAEQALPFFETIVLLEARFDTIL